MHPTAHGRSDDDFATAGFAQALSSASTQARPEASPEHPLTQATPQASLARPGAYGKNEEGLAATGFAQVILGAAGSRRNVKDSRQQPKEQDKRPATAPVTMSLPTVVTAPLPDIEGAPVRGAAESPAETDEPAINQDATADSAPEVSRPPAAANPPLTSDTELAFAVRVQPAAAAGTEPGVSQPPLQRETVVSAQPLLKKTTENDTADPAVVQPVAAGAGSFLASHGQTLAQAETAVPASTAPDTPSAPAKAEEAKFIETPSKPAAVPLKDISLQVAQSGGQKVEVHLTQQTGEIRVAVHTGDSELAHGLQQGLSDLVGRLQESGSRAEAWRPGGPSVQTGPVLESSSSPSGSPRDDSQSYSGGSQQQQDGRRHSQSQRPAWVEELESSIGTEQSQGATYGIGS
jgi:hypothetical protein